MCNNHCSVTQLCSIAQFNHQGLTPFQVAVAPASSEADAPEAVPEVAPLSFEFISRSAIPAVCSSFFRKSVICWMLVRKSNCGISVLGALVKACGKVYLSTST